MKKTIIIASLLLAFNAMAAQENVRTDIANILTENVNKLKEGYKSVETKLEDSLGESTTLKNQAIILKDRSKEAEQNPKILNHGRASIKYCDYDTQNLIWDGNNWDCKNANISKDCEPGQDEYRYEKDGVTYCSKAPSGETLNYYWRFRNYSAQCVSPSEGFRRLYDCYYKNKDNVEVQVPDTFCSAISKPPISVKHCYTSWRKPGKCPWCQSNSSHNKYVKVYGTCPSGYRCLGERPYRMCMCQSK